MPVLVVFVRFFRAIGRGLKEPEFRGLFFWVLVLLGVGTWFYARWEGWSYLDAFYFSVITLTTVGYGDFSPQTSAGKIFTIAYILLGLGILSSFIVLLAEYTGRDQGGIFGGIIQRRIAGRVENDHTEIDLEEEEK
ncbi:MAG: two pore domain potassium channel family protein [Anaerolineales bacterium]|nr:two pore domain potassium channel family protein [Anaerolineales bacterium]